MWPLYDPSMYQPPSPTERLTLADVEARLAEWVRQPDADNVFEVLSMLRGQESFRPARLSFLSFVRHPFMLVPTLAFVAWMVVLATRRPEAAQATTGLTNPLAVFAQSPGAAPGASFLMIALPALVVILVAVRASIREKDPELVAIRTAAAAAITQMALDPKYVGEEFSSSDRSYLTRLLRNRGAESQEALALLLKEREP